MSPLYYCSKRTTVRSQKQMWKVFRRLEPCGDDYKLETMTLLMGMNMS